MFNLNRAINYYRKTLPLFVVYMALPAAYTVVAMFLAALFTFRPQFQPAPAVLCVALGLALPMIVWELAARFAMSLYGLKDAQEGKEFLRYKVLGRLTFSPYLIIRDGAVAFGSDIVKNGGGPAGLVIHRNNAVVTEKWGRLKRVILGPAFPNLDPFEKVWDVIDLRPQRWVFLVSAITHDGIPIEYDADVRFQVGETEEEVFKAATCKWIRDAWRTEPDRLMIWTKRVVIGDTEGILRSILARYTLDQLIDAECRQAVRDELQTTLAKSVTGMGVKIIQVALGDIKLRGQVVEQWIDTWRAEREREMNRIIVEGKAERVRTLEKARTEVRKRMLDKAVEVFEELTARDGKVSAKLVTLSFIEMLKRTSFEQSLYLPENMVTTIEKLQKKIESGSTE